MVVAVVVVEVAVMDRWYCGEVSVNGVLVVVVLVVVVVVVWFW